jgi:hypothetical protein
MHLFHKARHFVMNKKFRLGQKATVQAYEHAERCNMRVFQIMALQFQFVLEAEPSVRQDVIFRSSQHISALSMPDFVRDAPANPSARAPGTRKGSIQAAKFRELDDAVSEQALKNLRARSLQSPSIVHAVTVHDNPSSSTSKRFKDGALGAVKHQATSSGTRRRRWTVACALLALVLWMSTGRPACTRSTRQPIPAAQRCRDARVPSQAAPSF